MKIISNKLFYQNFFQIYYGFETKQFQILKENLDQIFEMTNLELLLNLMDINIIQSLKKLLMTKIRKNFMNL